MMYGTHIKAINLLNAKRENYQAFNSTWVSVYASKTKQLSVNEITFISVLSKDPDFSSEVKDLLAVLRIGDFLIEKMHPVAKTETKREFGFTTFNLSIPCLFGKITHSSGETEWVIYDISDCLDLLSGPRMCYFTTDRGYAKNKFHNYFKSGSEMLCRIFNSFLKSDPDSEVRFEPVLSLALDYFEANSPGASRLLPQGKTHCVILEDPEGGETLAFENVHAIYEL